MCRFKVGDKVVVIDDRPGFKHPEYCPPFKKGDVGVILRAHEDLTVMVDLDTELMWHEVRFAPLDRLRRNHNFEITCTLPESVDEVSDEPVKIKS